VLWESPAPGTEPYFSVCIPQYGRFPFLLKALASCAEQDFRSFEVCISDGASPERRHGEVVAWLEASGIPFRYERHEESRPYDRNLRHAIALARGRYCLLMGNDDALARPTTLRELHDAVEGHGPAGVVIADFEQHATGARAHRIRQTANCGGGPDVAAAHFRNFSFVSGILLDRQGAQALATDRWDGSEMYQTYVGCRLIASGMPLLELDLVTVSKDVQLPGEAVDSFERRPRLDPCPIEPRPLPLRLLGRVVLDAIRPHTREGAYQRLVRKVFRQLVGFTYPYWLVTYRRVQSWRYAAGIALGMRPRVLLQSTGASRLSTLSTQALFGVATTAGLLVPGALFGRLQSRLYALAKRSRASGSVAS
jgi:glycosyltransferase involved in cell wall biosynthesis